MRPSGRSPDALRDVSMTTGFALQLFLAWFVIKCEVFGVRPGYNLFSALADVAKAFGQSAPVALRVNPDLPPKTHAKTDTSVKGVKFGLDIDTVLERRNTMFVCRFWGSNCEDEPRNSISQMPRSPEEQASARGDMATMSRATESPTSKPSSESARC